MILNFVKMSGAGNDFIMVDNRQKIIPASRYSALAKKLCRPRVAIGADGLIFLEKGKKLALRMRYFNADGSEAAMCGNGVRCLAVFAYFSGYKKRKFALETKAGLISVTLGHLPEKLLSSQAAVVRVKLPPPQSLKLDFSLKLDDETINASFLNTGVPHTVIFTDNLSAVDVNNQGRKIRYHQKFGPAGTNVNFVRVINQHNIHIRTYERGVEAETLACGTGATAAAILSGIKGLTRPPVKVKTVSGEVLQIDYQQTGSKIADVYLTGKVQVNFIGKTKIQEVQV